MQLFSIAIFTYSQLRFSMHVRRIGMSPLEGCAFEGQSIPLVPFAKPIRPLACLLNENLLAPRYLTQNLYFGYCKFVRNMVK